MNTPDSHDPRPALLPTQPPVTVLPTKREDDGRELYRQDLDLINTQITMRLPDYVDTEKEFFEWIEEKIKYLEFHEFMEWFKVDGNKVHEPHPDTGGYFVPTKQDNQ